MRTRAGKSFLLSAVVGSVAFAAADTQAAMMMELSDGITTTTITDGDGNDRDGRAGVIDVSQTVGMFDLSISVGLSTPFLGSTTMPVMDLNSINTNSSGAGTLTVKLTSTDFVGPLPGGDATLNAGGTTNGSIQISSYIDTTNTAFGEGTPTALLGIFNNGAFSGTLTSEVVTASPYSATIKAVITHDQAKDTSSFDAEFLVVPEPSSALLVGLGIAGLAARRRRG